MVLRTRHQLVPETAHDDCRCMLRMMRVRDDVFFVLNSWQVVRIGCKFGYPSDLLELGEEQH